MPRCLAYLLPFCFNDPATTEIYTLSLHDALPICCRDGCSTATRPCVSFLALIGASGPGASSSCVPAAPAWPRKSPRSCSGRSEEHTSELQSRPHLVCRLLLEKKKKEYNENFLPL